MSRVHRRTEDARGGTGAAFGEPEALAHRLANTLRSERRQESPPTATDAPDHARTASARLALRLQGNTSSVLP